MILKVFILFAPVKKADGSMVGEYMLRIGEIIMVFAPQ